jgi:hypothetical protein
LAHVGLSGEGRVNNPGLETPRRKPRESAVFRRCDCDFTSAYSVVTCIAAATLPLALIPRHQAREIDPPEVGYLLIMATRADRSTGEKSDLRPTP